MRQEQELAALIQSDTIKVISFDVFDTLLKRPMMFPTDLFFLVEEQAKTMFDDILFRFYEMRLQADRTSRHKSAREDVSLDEIYASMAGTYALREDTAETLKELELAMERRLLRARKHVKRFFEAATETGKEVIIVSDTPFSSDTLCELLDMNGYSGWSKVYTSCEHGLLKNGGSLFKKVLADLDEEGISPEEVLHIGDNMQVDIEQASSLGMSTYHVPKACERFMQAEGFSGLWEGRLAEGNRRDFGLRLILGLVANTLFDDPFRDDLAEDSHFGGQLDIFGYSCIGPPLLSFVKWVIEESIATGYEELIFLARDGYHPYQYFERLSELYDGAPKAHYVVNSRAALLPATIRTSRDIAVQKNAHAVNQQFSLRRFLENRLMLPIDDDVEAHFLQSGYESLEDPVGNLANATSLALAFSESILDNCRAKTCLIREYYERYFAGKKQAVVDIGYRGTMQTQLSMALERPIDAYFFYTFNEAHRPAKHGYRVYPLLRANTASSATPWYNLAQFLEIGFCSLESTITDFERNDEGVVEPVFDDTSMPEETREVFADIHEGVISFIDDCAAWFGDLIPYLNINVDDALFPLMEIIESPAASDALPFAGVEFEDKVQCGDGPQPRLVGTGDFQGPVLWRQGNEALKKRLTGSMDMEQQRLAAEQQVDAFATSIVCVSDMPLLSVIIPVYKTESFLPSCFNYLLAQTYDNLEIIVVDDGSPGNCKYLTERHQQIDPRIRYVPHSANLGLFQARLTGIQAASGEYIAHYDPDDRVLPDAYDKMMRAALSVQADIAHCNVCQTDLQGGMWQEPHCKIDYYCLEGADIFHSFFTNSLYANGTLRWHWHTIWNKIYKRSLLLSIPELWEVEGRIVMHEDLLSAIMTLFSARRMIAVPEILLYYLRHDASATLDQNDGRTLSVIQSNGRVFMHARRFLQKRKAYGLYKSYLDIWVDRHAGNNKNYVLHTAAEENRSQLTTAFNDAYATFGHTI